MPARIAVIQKPPVLLDRDGTIAKAIEAIDEAADAGASLLVFPEAWDSRLSNLGLAPEAGRRHGAVGRTSCPVAPKRSRYRAWRFAAAAGRGPPARSDGRRRTA